MIAKINNSRTSGYLYTGLIALIFALVACLYLFRRENNFTHLDTGIIIEEYMTEPMPPFIPGMWQITY